VTGSHPVVLSKDAILVNPVANLEIIYDDSRSKSRGTYPITLSVPCLSPKSKSALPHPWLPPDVMSLKADAKPVE